MKKKISLLIVLIIVLGALSAGCVYYYFNIYNVTDSQTNQKKEDVVEEPEDTQIEETTITFTGDVELSDYVVANYDRDGIDGVLDEGLLKLLNNSTYTMVNNEFCYSLRGEKAPDKQFTFRLDPKYVSVLRDMGVDVAGIANNHVLDFGRDALSDTFTTLDESGINYIGAGDSLDRAKQPVFLQEDDGKQVAIIAASRVIPVESWDVRSKTPGVFTAYDPTLLIEEVKAAKEKSDKVFVYIHWGVEHTTKLEDYQINTAHALIDAGADGVIGMHSHCLQPVEVYNGKPIFYSLGNFIFNQNIESTAAVQITLIPGESDSEMKVKIYPASASGAKTSLESGRRIFDYLENISAAYNIKIDDEGNLALD